MYVSGLRSVLTLRGPASRAAHFVDLLITRSEEFRELWQQHLVRIRPEQIKRYQHTTVGHLELSCQILLDPESSQALLVYTAAPGSESHEKLQLLSMISVAPPFSGLRPMS